MNSRIPAQVRAWLFLLLGIFVVLRQPMLSVVAAADDLPAFQVSQRWPLSGPGGSDFLLVSNKDHRLYISRDTRVTVLDTNTGATTGEIEGLTDVHGIALDPEGRFGYIGDGISGTLKVFSVPTLKLAFSIKIGGTADAVVVDPITHRVFVFDTHNNNAVIIDPSSQQVVGTLKLPGRPAAAVAEEDGSVLVNLVSTSQLARIDARTLTTQKLEPLKPCVGPSGIALDLDHSRVFSVCENSIMAVSDSHTGELVTTVPVGVGAKTASFDPANHLVFSANGEGTLTVIREDSAAAFSPIQTIKTDPGTRIVAFDSDRRQLYLLSAKYGQRTGPTSEELQFRPTVIPGSAVVLVIKP